MPNAKFAMATSRKRKSGEELTTWWNCSMIGRRAEILAQFNHWALVCDESYRRPKGRSLAKSAPPVPAFTLAPPRAG